MSKETPCIAVCMMDPKTNLCFGCGRTLPEIARWAPMERAERLAVMADCRRAWRRRADGGSRRGLIELPLARRARSEPLPARPPHACRHRRRRGRLWRSRADRARQRPGFADAAAAQRSEPAPAVQIARGQAGEFALHAKINGVKAPMVIDTGATSVVLTWETAKAIGLPLEMLEYNVERRNRRRSHQGGAADAGSPRRRSSRREIGSGAGGAARADENQSARHEFLDRLESWGVQADRLMLNGYPDVTGSINAPRRHRRDRAGGRVARCDLHPRGSRSRSIDRQAAPR